MVRKSIKRPRLNSKKKKRNRARRECEEAREAQENLEVTLAAISGAPNPLAAGVGFFDKTDNWEERQDEQRGDKGSTAPLIRPDRY